jgi:hypothetical protein
VRLTPNIGPVERRKRHRFGVAALALGVVVVWVARAQGMPLWIRGAAAVFFFLGFTGIFQARAHTCVALARHGARDMDGGPESIEDAEQLAAVRAQARRVLLRSVIATLAVTAASLVLP